MSYAYKDHRPYIFTEEGSVEFVRARDKVLEMMNVTGAAQAWACLKICGSGNSYHHWAIIDRMVELGDIRYAHKADSRMSQYWIVELAP